MEKNRTFIGTCEAYTYDGLGVVHHEDFVFFVPRLLVGETAELATTKWKKRFGYARIVKLLETSKHRQEPICSVAKQCGGCQLLHMDEAEQKIFKEDKVRGCFRMNAGIDVDVLPIITSNPTVGYRNKVQVPVDVVNNQVEMGFYHSRSNQIVSYDYCHMQSALSNAITKDIKKWITQSHCGKAFRHVLVKHAHKSGEVMVCFVVKKHEFKGLNEIVNHLLETYPDIKTITTIENRRSDNVILDGTERILYGEGYIQEELLGKEFRISAKSFFQINPYTTAKLYQKALELAKLDETQTVIDLYCGTGTIGLLASEKCKKVYGIEIVEEAIKDAKKNAEINQIHNISFLVGDAGKGANQLIKNHIQPNVVIVDPPRKGCSKDTLDAIVKMNPERIVYISCDPATLARDCKYLLEKEYNLEIVQPFDMFPNSVHVETVILLCRAVC